MKLQKSFFQGAVKGAAMVVCAGVLAACGGGKTLGVNNNAPDEFAIVTKAPLVVPPDFALRPPRPGESRPQELSTSERAQQVLLGQPGARAPSVGEQVLLRKAGALNADPNIRALLNAEAGGRADKDRSLANQLLFWQFDNGEVDDSAAPLRVDDPDAWMRERQKLIDDVVGEEADVEIGGEASSKTLRLPGVF